MKSRLKRDDYKRIYEMLDKVSPIDGDCGKLCGSLCCTCDENDASDEFDMGIYLLPGEDKLFTKKEDWLVWSTERAEDYEYPDSWHGKVYFIHCKTPPVCDRGKRPIQCRTFPLAPHLTEDGSLVMITYSGGLPYECPLISDSIKLNDDFVKTTWDAWNILITDPLIYDLVEMDSRYRDMDGQQYNIVFSP